MRSANGSTWMSLARRLTASWMIRLTSLTTGASFSSPPPAAAGRLRFGEVDGGVGELGEHRVDRLGFGLAVVPVDGLDDLLARRQDGLNIFVQDELEFLNGVEVGRVAHDDLERAVLLRQRQDDVFAGDRFGHQFDDGGRDGDFGQVDELQAVELGDGAHDLFGGGVAELDEGVCSLAPVCCWMALRFVELIGAEELAAKKDVGEIAARLGHERSPPGSFGSGCDRGEAADDGGRQCFSMARRLPEGKEKTARNWFCSGFRTSRERERAGSVKTRSLARGWFGNRVHFAPTQ